MALEREARSYYLRRRQAEGHEHTDFFVHSPRTTLVQLMATGFMKNRFYMGTKEIVDLSIAAHAEAIKSDPSFHLDCLRVFRSVARIKDQVVMGLAMREHLNDSGDNYNKLMDVMRLLPPHLLLRYVTLLRKMKTQIGSGFGRRAKRQIAEVMQSWDDKKFAYYCMAYRAAMWQLMRVAHPPIKDSEKTEQRVRWVKSLKDIYQCADDAGKAYSQIANGMVSDTKKIIALAAEYNLPFELIRTHLKVPSEPFTAEAIDIAQQLVKITPPDALILNLRLFGKLIGDYPTSLMVAKKNTRKVSPYRIAIAGFAVKETMPVTYNALDSKYREAMSHVELLPELEAGKFTLVLDASSSMFMPITKPGATFGEMRAARLEQKKSQCYEMNALLSVSPYFKICERYIAFSEENTATELPVPRIEGLKDIETQFNYLEQKFNHGTDVAGAINLAVMRAPGSPILLISDEQENCGTQVHRLLQARTVKPNITVINPSPYPSHAFSQQDVKYVPACLPETINAVLRMQQISNFNEDQSKAYVMKLTSRFFVQPETQEIVEVYEGEDLI